MKCNQDCEQGRRCDCDEDLCVMDAWALWAIGWAAGISLSVILLTIVAYLFGRFA